MFVWRLLVRAFMSLTEISVVQLIFSFLMCEGFWVKLKCFFVVSFRGVYVITSVQIVALNLLGSLYKDSKFFLLTT